MRAHIHGRGEINELRHNSSIQLERFGRYWRYKRRKRLLLLVSPGTKRVKKKKLVGSGWRWQWVGVDRRRGEGGVLCKVLGN